MYNREIEEYQLTLKKMTNETEINNLEAAKLHKKKLEIKKEMKVREQEHEEFMDRTVRRNREQDAFNYDELNKKLRNEFTDAKLLDKFRERYPKVGVEDVEKAKLRNQILEKERELTELNFKIHAAHRQQNAVISNLRDLTVSFEIFLIV